MNSVADMAAPAAGIAQATRSAAPPAPQQATANSAPPQTTASKDTFQASAKGPDYKFWVRDMGIPVVVGTGLGIYAGACTGILPAIAGIATGFCGGAILGVVGASVVSRVFKNADDVFTRMSFPSAIAGAVGGAIGGGVIGATTGNPVATIGMGIVGALGGGLYAVSRIVASSSRPPH